MADSKLSALTEVTTLAATDELYVNDGGSSARSPLATLGKYIATGTHAGGTLTANAPMTLTQIWNSAGVTFTSLKMDVTDTASNAASLLLDLQVGGASKIQGTKAGAVLGTPVSASTVFASTAFPTTGMGYRGGTVAFFQTGTNTIEMSNGWRLASSGTFQWTSAGHPATGADTALARKAAAVVAVTNNSTGGGGLQFVEMTAPTAPAANNCILFAEDDGAGKTRLVVRFPTGSDVVLATEA